MSSVPTATLPFTAPPRGRLPTTAQGAEACLLIVFLGQRGLALAQLAAALPAGLAISPRPMLDAAFASLFLVASTALAVITVRRRTYRSLRLGVLDTAVGMTVLLGEALVVPVDSRFTSWAGWAYPVSLGAAGGAAIAFPRLWQVTTVVAALAASYLAVTLLPATGDQVSTAITNVLAYPAFAIVLRGLAGYLRRLAAAADSAREQAAWLAAHAERTLHRRLLHDQASVLALLSEPLDERLAVPLRRQAADGAARIRWFLTADDTAYPPPAAGDTGGTARGLRDQVLDTCASFADLPLVANVDLATHEPPLPVTVSVIEALATLLHNVRRHAQAHEVVVHLETTATSWELTVRDDGKGFDTTQVPSGYGLEHQVVRPVEEVGGHVTITSEPGAGTTVRLAGPSA